MLQKMLLTMKAQEALFFSKVEKMTAKEKRMTLTSVSLLLSYDIHLREKVVPEHC